MDSTGSPKGLGMRTRVVAGADGPAVTALPLGHLAPEQRAFNRAVLGSLGERILRVIGRALLGLPASTWLLVDVSVVSIGIYVAFAVFPPPDQLATPHVALWQALAVFAFAVIVASLVFGLYERETLMSRSRILTRTGLTACTATVIAYAIIYVIMYATVSRRVSGLAMSLFLVVGVGIRLGAWWVVRKVHCGLLVVGSRNLFEIVRAGAGQ